MKRRRVSRDSSGRFRDGIWVAAAIAGSGLTAIGLALAVAAGLVNQLSSDGATDNRTAYSALAVYWLLFVLLVLVVAGWKAWWKQFLLGFCSIVLAMGIAEVALRILAPHYAVASYRQLHSPDLHHVPAPDRYMHHFFGKRSVFVQTNPDGLRSEYTRTQFGDLDVRVACLGDSFTFGVGVNAEHSYPFLLEEELRSKLDNPNVGVLNAGVISYSPILQSRILDRVVVHYRPQLVLMMLDCTDIGDDHQYANEEKRNRVGDQPFAGLAGDRSELHLGALWRVSEDLRNHEALSAPFRLMRRLWRGKTPAYNYYDFQVQIDDTLEQNRFFIYRHPLEKTRPYFDHTWSYIERVAARCEEINAQFVLLIAPRFHHWNSEECERNWESTEYALDEPYQNEIFRYFEEKAETAPFAIRSLLPAFQACDQFPLVFSTDPHWNPEGNRFVAETVANLLVDELNVFTDQQRSEVGE